eukprot:TRINITY_DN3924_c0_g1_i3.p1 TRINITY_DN3924_c0_g1~~TRINITY_DN3924_c0_g1_i3.p1  ORF type:complete len:230 (-),score=40.63 TRINITY_DN3924_c0_g1_i3:4-615(-)
MKSSIASLSLLLFVSIILVILCSSAVYFAETSDAHYNYRDRWFYTSYTKGWVPFQSVVHSFWWNFATIATVGYGDAGGYPPLTPQGKIVACLTIVFGVIMLSFPSAVLTMNWLDYWDAAIQKEQEFRREKAIKDPKPQDLVDLSDHLHAKVKNLKLNIDQVKIKAKRVSESALLTEKANIPQTRKLTRIFSQLRQRASTPSLH